MYDPIHLLVYIICLFLLVLIVLWLAGAIIR